MTIHNYVLSLQVIKDVIHMKKLVLATFLVLFSLISIGQKVKHVSLDYNMDNFELRQDDDGNFIILSNDYDAFLKSDTLLPALPYIGCNVLIRNNESYISHICSDKKSLVQSNVMMAHNPEVIPTNMSPALRSNSMVTQYSQNSYPTVNVEYVGVNECEDYRILTFHICPFEYDVTTRKLYLRKHIDLDIRLDSFSPITSESSGRKRYSMNNIIKQMVINPDDLEGQDNPKLELRSSGNLTQQTGYEYVIVTSNQFKSTFQELANWKTRKGIRATVLTVEDIISEYSGTTKAEKIKRALADIDNLSYVLLGGDTLNIPTCMCYIGTNANTDSITPADSYYSCLGTMNWDNNGNGFYGELTDTVSLIPSLNVSRAPVSTIDDAQVFVNRIINYESSPDTTNWKNDILMCGTSLGYKENNVWHPYYVNGQSDTQKWSQMIYDQYIAPSNPNLPSWDTELTRFYDTYTDISGDETYDFNASNLQNEIAKGYTFVDVMTHGSKTTWTMEGNNNSYNRSHANNLENNGYTVITTTACLTNAFDYHTTNGYCLSHHFMNNPQSGILAYWGTSRENWYAPRSFNTLGSGATFDALTYRKLLLDRFHRMGKATTEVKIEKMASAVSLYTSNRKIWMGLNLMGDPEMPLYLSKPQTFNNVQILSVNDSLYVDAGTGDFDICFINQDDSSEYYIAREIIDSVAVFTRLNGVFDVCITKPNYIPYITACEDIYLQNTTLTGTNNYETSSAMIGSNVTNKVAQGPVVINTGSTLIKASHGAVITKDFEVKSGAEFIITN